MVKIAVKLLKNPLEKSVGLLVAKKAEPVFFETRFGIHTFFLKFPIDVLILDSNQKIVKLAEYLSPNRVFLWNPRFKRVLELPAGFIEKQKLKVGDTASFEITS